jgi:catechol 2,3-dioxygenase-like lactoylglutathione lyase family enzyme
MIRTKGVVHFTIPVRDWKRAEAFYTKVMGFEVVQRVPPTGMVFMKSGENFFVLTESKGPVGSPPEDKHLVHTAFQVDADKYDAALATLKENGVEVVYEEDRREGVFPGRQTYFRDPDGNMLEIIALRGRDRP